MHGFVAPTDQSWFDFLSKRPDLEEVNFWAPSGKAMQGSMPWGSPFFFKLKRPHHAIGGFGFLGPVMSIPLSMAWEAFGEKNGAASLAEMRTAIAQYREDKGKDLASPRGLFDPNVGCRTILQPVFFPRDLWVPVPSDWARNIVTGKGYDLSQGEGRRLWEQCRDHARTLEASLRPAVGADGPIERWGKEQTIRPRLGQGAFRLAVTDAYGRACAVTGEHSLPVLDSAHIQPYADGGAHEVRNGILLRTDLHRLYDRGYVTVTPDHEFRVGEALREEFDNGKVYYELEAAARGRIRLPTRGEDWPDRESLEWHVHNVFKG